MKNNKRFLLVAISAIACFQLFAQTPGMIFEPATGPGQAVLDPNADGYVSSTTGGFVANDQTESEIPYVPMVFPGLEPTSDLGPGPNCGFTDFVDSGTEDPAMIYYDGINLIFRMRMGNALPNSKGYSVLVDTDQLFGLSGPNADPNATQNNPGFEIEINLQTNFGVFVYPVDGACATVPSSSFPGHTNYSKAIALTTNCANPDYFYDFYVPFSSLTALGITIATPLRMAIITQMNPQPAICNNALSDFGGIDDNTCGSNPWDCWTEIIENYPPTPVGNVNVPAPDMSVCPFINTPIMNGATVVSGTSSHVNGTVITVYKNAVSIGTAIVASNAWSLTGITPALSGGDIITATAQAPLRTVSTSNCNPRTVAATCTAPLVNGLVSGNAKAVCGAAGAGIPGASVLVYDQNGNLVNNNLVTTVAADGSFLWKCNATTANCNSGPNCLANGAYYVTQTFGTECESVGIWICVGNSTPTTAVPTITTPVLSTGNFVSGTSAANATIYVWSGSVLVGTTIATAGGAWTLTPVSLTLGQSLTAQAIVTGSCASALTAPVIVSRNTVAPIVTGTYCTIGPITSVTGTSTEATGTVIQVYRNAIAHGSTTTVNISGNWTANVGISVSPGDVITARATATGCAQSVSSNSVTVGNQTTSSVTITTSPIMEGASSISGTGSNGDLITLYVDGYPEGTTTVSGGVWTVSGLNQFTIYATGLVTATATSPGNCPSAATPPIVAQCIMPNISLQVNAIDTSVCGTTVTPIITVVNSQAGIVYQLFNGATPTGSSILGTGANITLTSAPITVSTTLTVRAIKIGMPGCISTLTDAVQVFVNPNPSVTLSVAPASASVCQNGSTTINVALSQSGFSYQLKNLATNANVGTAVAGTGGTINLPTGTLTATTSYYIIATGAAPTLCSDTLNNQATVTVTPVTTSNAGTDSTLICGNNSLPLTANTPSAGTGAWTIISGTGGSFANAAVPTTTFTGTTGQTYVLRWTITNGTCSSFDEVTIVIPAAPTTSNAGSTQTLSCGTTTTNLAGNPPIIGTGVWTILSGVGGSVAAPSSPSSSFTGVAGQTYVLSWTITNGTCSSSSSVTIIVPANPTTSNAGSNQTLACGVTTTNLTGNIAVSGTGLWSIVSGIGGSVATPSSESSSFTGVAGQTYVLSWTITNGTCSSSSSVTIIVPANPTTSNAGSNQTLACGVTTTNLTANIAVSGTGLWSIVSGIGGSVATPSSESSSFTGVAGQTYVLSWTITNGTCSSSSSVTIIVPANPTTSNAGSNQTLACGVTTTNLTANIAVSGTGLWSIVSGIGGSVATPSSESSSFTGVAGQTYVLSWTITNGTCSSSSSVTVIVPANPTTSNAGSNQTLACGVTTTNLTANIAVSGTGLWSIVSGIGGSVATPSSESSSFTGVAGQTYVLSWTITNGTCSSSSSVTIIVPANPTTSNAGSNQTLACGVTTTNLTANTAVSGTGLWSIVSGIGGSVATPSSESSSFTGVAGQTYVLSWTITNGTCSSSSNVTIIVPADPTPSAAGSNQTVPCGTSSINLTANTPSSGTGSWTILSGSGGSISNSASPNSSFSGTAGQTYLLTWTITAGVCASVDSVTIAFDATPTTASVGATQTLPCGIVSTNLSGNTALIGNGNWTILSGSGGSVSNPSSETSLFTGVAGQTYQLQWTISSGSCSSSATLTVVVPPSSVTISNAGTDQTGAAMCGVTSTILAANTPTTGTGSWSIFSGTGGSFGNALLPNTTFTGLAGQSYQLLWTISDASCTSVDTVNVTFFAAPTVSNAGSNQTLSCGATSTALAGNTATTGIGTWTILSGTGGSLVNANDESSIFNGSVGETYVLEWTIANGPCTSTSSVTITLPVLPTTANAGTNQTLGCGILSTALSGNPISSGTGAWTILSGTGGSLANATSESSGFTGIAGQTYLLTWTSSTASCATVDSVTIVLPQLPNTSSAGSDQTLACGTTNTMLNANTASSGTGNWTIISGTGGSFGNPTSETSTFFGTAGETYILSWTITVGACSSMDSVTVMIPELPTTSNAGSNQTLVCGDVTAVMSANIPVTGTGTWTITSGIGGSFNNANSDTATFTGNPGETYVLTWTITNGPCSSSSSVTIIVPASSVTISNAGTDQTGVAMCGVTSTMLSANAASAGTGSWIILSGNGGVLANASSPTSGFTGVAGETYVLQWFITDGNCNSMDDVIVDFPEIPTTSVAGADDTLSCGNTATTLAANAPVIGIGTWSVVSGIGGSFANANSDTSAFSGTAGESYVLVWTIANGPCESNDTVNVIMPAAPTVATAGLDQTLNCGDVTAVLAGNVAVSGTGTWSIITGIGGSINTPSAENAILTGLPNETYVLTWTITSGICSTIDTVTVVIPPSTVTISNAGPDQTGASMCGVTNTLLSANLAALGTGYWTIISGTGGVFADSSLAASAFTGIAGQTYTLQWMISDTVCASSDDVIIAFAELPTTANAGGDDTLICGVTATTLSATPTTIGTGMWTILSGTGGNLVDADSATSGFTGTQGETYLLVWTTTNGPCTSTDTVSVFMPAAITAANAGADQTLACGDLTAALAADSALSGTGMWNIISGNGGSINTPTDENAILTGIANETYILTWTVTSGPCSSIDTVTIVIPANAVTVSNAGLDQTGSSLCGMTSTTLGANIATQGTGNWIIVSGTGGSFVDAADPNTSFSGVAGQTYTLQWVITDAACSSTDDVIISFPVLASTADAGNDAFLPCTSVASSLSANVPANGNGMWSQLSGPVVTISTPSSPNTSINGLTPGSYAFVWTVSSAPCPASADTVYLEVLACDSGLIIPSGFSPNGDGTNDYFELVGIGAYPDNKVTIFNRWGTLIYESAGYDNGAVRWEGNNSGELSIGSGPVPEATYFYVIDLGDGSKLLSGYVFLNRQ